jgi:Secretion system C-terminal sorting domain
MKKQCTILMLAFVFTQTLAQLPTHFAPIGTRWEYNFFSYGQSYGKFTHESEGDTLINGVTHRVVKTTRKTKCDFPPDCPFTTTISKNFYTIRNDSLLSVNGNGYRLLFNFGYRVGDSVSLLYGSLRKAVISRIGDTTINSKRLKFWEIKQTCTPTRQRYGNIYELIGSADDGFYEFEDQCTSDPNSKRLCSVKTVDWTYEPQICRYSVATKETVEINATVYPNPVLNQLTIDYSLDNFAEKKTLVIHDVLGKTVHQQILADTTPSVNVDMSGLNAGIYLLSIQSHGKQLFHKRLVKY